MAILSELPKFKIDEVKSLLMQYDLETTATRSKRSRNSSSIVFENIILNDIYFGRANSKRYRTLFANVSEKQPRMKTTGQQHLIEIKFADNNDSVQTLACTTCNKAKATCNAIVTFVCWIQHNPTRNGVENIAPNANVAKNQTKACYVLIKNEGNMLIEKKVKNVLAKLEPKDLQPIRGAIEAAVELTKPKKEPIPITPLELESAQKLSMISLIREFTETSAEDFLKFCTARMKQENNCGAVQLLTIEQADTDLWHELRKGRITASRMHEASRCTMLSGSLTNKIMGISSGFSFAMKRGTDLEGHVFAEIQKEYPDLRNTGLVLDPDFPWMGASPDGICDEFVLEIKCPYTQKTYDCYVDVTKLSKKYFAQIQLQMHMTHKSKALLAVAALDFEETKNVTKVWIDYDKTYVDTIMAESYEFWRKAIYKALLKKRTSKK